MFEVFGLLLLFYVVYRGWSWGIKGLSMERDGEKGLGCPKIMDGKASNGNGVEKTVPSCCLKAMACLPEEDAKCHSTVVSGWFSEPHPRSGHITLLCFLVQLPYFLGMIVLFLVFVLNWIQGKKEAKQSISITLCGQVGLPLDRLVFVAFQYLLP